MTEQTLNAGPVPVESRFKVTYTIKISDFLTIIPILIGVWYAHQSNLENIQKINDVIVKYETQIDKIILADDKKHTKYVSNLKRALSSLSKEERKVLLAIYSVDK
ncbi:MAG: hypothetical protein ACI9LG_001658 [Moritella dasanensis]|jgi:hypothetical protein